MGGLSKTFSDLADEDTPDLNSVSVFEMQRAFAGSKPQVLARQRRQDTKARNRIRKRNRRREGMSVSEVAEDKKKSDPPKLTVSSAAFLLLLALLYFPGLRHVVVAGVGKIFCGASRFAWVKNALENKFSVVNTKTVCMTNKQRYANEMLTLDEAKAKADAGFGASDEEEEQKLNLEEEHRAESDRKELEGYVTSIIRLFPEKKRGVFWSWLEALRGALEKKKFDKYVEGKTYTKAMWVKALKTNAGATEKWLGGILSLHDRALAAFDNEIKDEQKKKEITQDFQDWLDYALAGWRPTEDEQNQVRLAEAHQRIRLLLNDFKEWQKGQE